MKDNVIKMDTSDVGSVANPSKPHDNGGTGGNGNMNNDKYVTHKEFDDAMHKIDKSFDDINLKFEEQKVWLLKELSATAIFIVTILGFLISIIALLK